MVCKTYLSQELLVMLKNFLITIFRQILRKPKFYILNIFGLSIGIAAFILMYNHASYELSFDQFHDRYADIYRLNLEYTPEGKPTYVGASVFGGVGPTLVSELPQVETAVRIVPGYDGGGIIRYGDKMLRTKEIQYTESSFFKVFSYPLVEGNIDNCLEGLNKVVLSINMASIVFGDEDPIGKTIKLESVNGEADYLVTGLFESRPDSHFHGEVLLSLSTLEIPWEAEFDTNWRFFDFNTYFKKSAGSSIEDIENQFPKLIAKYRPQTNSKVEVNFGVIPITDIHLKSHINQELEQNGDNQVVTFLLIISFLVLLIAMINYVNLYTAHARDRGKEVGIRKTLGSNKSLLRLQFLMESFVMNLISLLLALLIVNWVANPLSTYTGLDFSTNYFNSTSFWIEMVLLWLLSSVLAGFYPALVISDFKPISALRSVNVQSSGKLRKVIVTWQFMASAGLIVGALVIHQQLTEMENRPTGINTDDLIIVGVPNFTNDYQTFYSDLNNFKNDLLNHGAIINVSYASDAPGEQVNWRGGSTLIGTNSDVNGGMVFKLVVDKDYADTYDLKFISGRNFRQLSETRSVILNEKALGVYGFSSAEEALNKRIWFSNLDTLQVIGVVEDFHQESLREPIKPTAYIQNYMGLKYVFVRTRGENREENLGLIQTEFEEHFPRLPFDWTDIEDQLKARHTGESEFKKAFNLFVLLAIFISMLGLLGLVSFMAQQRQKEMAVRKVLGSSVLNVVYLFFGKFLKLAIIGNAIAIPIIYFIANDWLNGFAFRIDFLWWSPLLAFVLSIILAFGTTIRSILKVAKLNPARILNRE